MAIKLRTRADFQSAIRQINQHAETGSDGLKDHVILANSREEQILKKAGGAGTINKVSTARQYSASGPHDGASGNASGGNAGAGGSSSGGNGGPDGGGSNISGPGGGPHSPGGAGGPVGGDPSKGGSPDNNGGGYGPHNPSMGTSVGGMGTNTQGFGPEATSKPEVNIDHSLLGAIGRAFRGLVSDDNQTALGPTGEKIGTVTRQSLSVSNMNNVSKAYREAVDDNSLSGMIGRALGIGKLDPTSISQPAGVDPNAPAVTGRPNIAIDPIGAALSAAGLVNPAASVVSAAYQGMKALTGYRGPQIGLGNLGTLGGTNSSTSPSVGVDTGVGRGGNPTPLGLDTGGSRPGYAAQPNGSGAPAPAAPAPAAGVPTVNGITVATGRDRNWQTLLNPSSATGTVL